MLSDPLSACWGLCYCCGPLQAQLFNSSFNIDVLFNTLVLHFEVITIFTNNNTTFELFLFFFIFSQVARIIRENNGRLYLVKHLFVGGLINRFIVWIFIQNWVEFSHKYFIWTKSLIALNSNLNASKSDEKWWRKSDQIPYMIECHGAKIEKSSFCEYLSQIKDHREREKKISIENTLRVNKTPISKALYRQHLSHDEEASWRRD